jgi:cytochrome d ubiquinol oxidase subunit II
MTGLQIAWFFLIGVLLIGYAILDGFDLGVGFWHLFTRNDEERRIVLNSIGPVWDGNEVWLLTGGGAIFAAFPPVYASVFSGFYLAMMLVLLALISRAVSLEFRSKVEDPRWRKTWDVVFAVSSSLAALLFGVALGNILRGVPLHDNGDYAGTFFGLLNPYALVIGLTGLAMLTTHGGLYLTIKAEHDLADRARSWAQRAWWAYIALAAVGTIWTLVGQPHLLRNYLAYPVLFVLPVAAVAAIVATRLWSKQGKDTKAFVASSVGIAGLMATAGVGLFPNLVPALGAPERSLTAFNASSSQTTLTAMLVVALVGMPLVLLYTAFIYRTFRGKVQLDEHSY